MEYVYSALLLNSAEKEINEENVTAILTAAGIEVDAGRVKALVAAGGAQTPTGGIAIGPPGCSLRRSSQNEFKIILSGKRVSQT